MNKIFKLFSVLTVLLLVMGLSSCVFIDAGSEQDWNNIRTEAQLNSFMNASATELSGALADNITLTDSVTAPSGKTRTLNLKGKNITINGTNTAIKAQGTLTIKDDSNTVPFTTTESEREIKHGIVKNSGQGFAVSALSGGTLIITGGVFQSNSTAVDIEGTASISNCLIQGDVDQNNDGDGLWVYGGTVANLSCTIEAAVNAIMNTGTITKIDGGTYKAEGSTDTAEEAICAIWNHGGTISEIANGTFTAINYSSAQTAVAWGLYNDSNGTVSNNHGDFSCLDENSHNNNGDGAEGNSAMHGLN